jgi:CheY-like chemotaxis protein
LEMALLNLAVNARDAMPHGGALSIDIRRDEVLEDAQAPLGAGSYVRVAVSDTGEGMDADTLARAVEPFFSTKAVGRGTGLGLSMVFGLAEQSGGALRLESAVGRGTTAHLWLPVAAGNAEKSDSTLTKPEVSSPAAILFVDDDVLVADSSVALLEDLGHSVTRAGSGGEALQILGQGLPLDLMITDYAMPEMTGVELGEAARRLRPGLPILLATGFADLEDAGTTDLPRLAKPYTQGQLAAQIARLLGRRGS